MEAGFTACTAGEEQKEFCCVRSKLSGIVSNGNDKSFLRAVNVILNGSSITC